MALNERVAVVACAPGLGPGCRRFEPVHRDHLICPNWAYSHAVIAQSVERRVENAGVGGSIPSRGTKSFL